MMDLSKFINVSSDQMFPCVGVIISQAFGVFDLQAQNMIPYDSVVRVDFIHHIIQIEQFICLRKQTVTSGFLYSGTFRDVFDQRRNALNLFRM